MLNFITQPTSLTLIGFILGFIVGLFFKRNRELPSYLDTAYGFTVIGFLILSIIIFVCVNLIVIIGNYIYPNYMPEGVVQIAVYAASFILLVVTGGIATISYDYSNNHKNK